MFRFFQGVPLVNLVEFPKFAGLTQRVMSALDQTLLALNRPSDFVYMIKGKQSFLSMKILRFFKIYKIPDISQFPKIPEPMIKY